MRRESEECRMEKGGVERKQRLVRMSASSRSQTLIAVYVKKSGFLFGRIVDHDCVFCVDIVSHWLGVGRRTFVYRPEKKEKGSCLSVSSLSIHPPLHSLLLRLPVHHHSYHVYPHHRQWIAVAPGNAHGSPVFGCPSHSPLHTKYVSLSPSFLTYPLRTYLLQVALNLKRRTLLYLSTLLCKTSYHSRRRTIFSMQ